jgi:hypothetical protein
MCYLIIMKQKRATDKITHACLTKLSIKYGMNQTVKFHDGYHGTRGKTYCELYHEIACYEKKHNIQGLVLGHIGYSC